MRTLLDPHLVDPSGREPGLVVDVRDRRRVLLFDLGDRARLSARTLLRSTHVFVTPASGAPWWWTPRPGGASAT